MLQPKSAAGRGRAKTEYLIKRTVFVVNRASDVLNFRSKLLIRLEISTTGNDELYENHSANPLWIFFQKSLKSTELVRYAFDDIQTVDPDNYFQAREPVPHVANHFLNRFLSKMPLKLRGLDAYWKCSNRYLSPATQDLGVKCVLAPSDRQISNC